MKCSPRRFTITQTVYDSDIYSLVRHHYLHLNNIQDMYHNGYPGVRTPTATMKDFALFSGVNTVSIGGLPLSIEKERLETVCKPFGNVIRTFLTDPTVLSTEYRNCTLTFSDTIDNNALVSNLQSNFPKEDFPQVSISVESNRVQKSVKVVQTLDSKRKLFINESWFRDQSIIYPNVSPLKVFR
ncbi:hypothetical protein LOD99_12132 [Oopsacas minuta]|uniref:RRM domain-containing protein n=1 Tax=Oopsacas minuta TaxID=111878 RepID=A0AAV7JI12_9METZ|nr:hypothetical protein LOD99_12132 [Oopsacas minuta]